MPPKASSTKLTIEQVKARHEVDLMAIEGVAGVGIGERREAPGLVIRVYVVRITPALKKRIPSELEGFPVQLEQTGEIHAF